MLAVEQSPAIPIVSKVPTIILGMDVSHGSPGQSDVPSIAAVLCFCFYLDILLCIVVVILSFFVVLFKISCQFFFW